MRLTWILATILATIAGSLPLTAQPAPARVGELAPDFTVARLDRPSEMVTLSKLAAEKPVVLIFGSYT
jgi:hypothetical protein